MGKYKQIYVLAPYSVTSGGIELAHQLVDALRNQGENAFIVYTEGEVNCITQTTTVTPAYNNYNIVTASKIDDNAANLLVLPETYFDWVYCYEKIQYAGWWMSVDNYYYACALKQQLSFHTRFGKRYTLIRKHLFKEKFRNTISDLIALETEGRLFSMYQSHYAKLHLLGCGFRNLMPLGDYINTDFLAQNKNLEVPREDIILYNPVKGFKFTSSIIKRMSAYTFVALKGYSREELRDLFQKSKLYIDFGHFPGKDRLMREAVLSGCCVITSRIGAAAYYEDVPIMNKYKFEVKKSSLSGITKHIAMVINNYNHCAPDFTDYRTTIEQEQAVFKQQVTDIFTHN